MGLYKRPDFWGNLLEKSVFLVSKLGNRPLLEHGPLIEILIILPEYITSHRIAIQFVN